MSNFLCRRDDVVTNAPVLQLVDGFHFPCRIIPKDFKKWYPQLPCLALGIQREAVENKRASSFVVPLSKALNGTPPPLCGRQVVQFSFRRESCGQEGHLTVKTKMS